MTLPSATPAPTIDAADPRAALRQLFGHSDFRRGQEEVVQAVLAGEDVLAVMPTGAGKSLCYQLPAMLLPGCTVVISPLVALMKDQVDSLPPEVRRRASVFNSTIERDELDAAMADLLAGRLKLVYVAPERLRQRPFLHALARARISRFVVDEAHCVSLWGHDFRPDYLFIPAVLATLGRPPVLAMTATATPALQAELSERLGRRMQTVHTGVLRPNLFLQVERLKDMEEKLRRLIDICTDERGAGIVYVTSRENTEKVAATLRRHGISARHYHAGLGREERAAVQDDFMCGRVRVIAATVAFGMGVDKADVRFIVHFNPSRSLEAYAQESGRAGRDGAPARCALFWSSSDKTALNRWAREDTLTPDLLRALYRALRAQGVSRFVWWPPESLVRAVQDAATAAGMKRAEAEDIDETTVRVALGALEQVGVLRRHCDLPETARIGPLLSPPGPLSPPLRGEGRGGEATSAESQAGEARAGVTGDGHPISGASPLAPEGRGGDATSAVSPLSGPSTLETRADEQRVVAERTLLSLGLGAGERAALSPMEVAARLGCSPAEVEERLLAAQDAGTLSYQGVGRGFLIELLPHPPDLAARLRGLIEGHEAAQLARAGEMTDYALRRLCRTATIARHFGVAHAGRCGNCDVCASRTGAAGGPSSDESGQPEAHAARSAAPQPDQAPEDIIIKAIVELPFPMGRTGVARLLAGSVASAVQADRSYHFGALGSMTVRAIRAEIDRMIEQGYLMMDDSDFRLLSVTPAGFAKPPAPWPPPAPHSSGRSRDLPQGSRRPAHAGAMATRHDQGGPDDGARAVQDAPEMIADGESVIDERFERLRAWRTGVAREANLPPYTVFHDATLRLLAATRITSRADLAQIKGLGPAKLERYGDALLEILREDDAPSR